MKYFYLNFFYSKFLYFRNIFYNLINKYLIDNLYQLIDILHLKSEIY